MRPGNKCPINLDNLNSRGGREFPGRLGRGVDHIGKPVPLMLARVRKWLAEGREVRIFTARVSGPDPERAAAPIRAWCRKHLGVELPITCSKDYDMIELWDDRCVPVDCNTGRVVGSPRGRL